jgi:hypothetical protein
MNVKGDCLWGRTPAGGGKKKEENGGGEND